MDTDHIQQLRIAFDSLDKQLLALLAERKKLSEKMGHFKVQNQITAYQPQVWQEHLQNRWKENEIFQLDVVFLQKIFDLIHEESIRIQNQILATKP